MQIKETEFNGFKAVELTTSKLKMAVVIEFGPRIAFFGRPDGENLFLWEPKKYTRNEWNLRGGHRVWITRPGADESEENYFSDNKPAEFKISGDGFTITGAKDPVNLTRRGIEVKVLEEDKLSVNNFVVNNGDMLFSAGVWGLTCTLPGPKTQYIIPIGDKSSWDYFKMIYFKEWAGHKGIVDDPQITVKEDHILITPQGKENKRALQTPLGIIAMNDQARDITFAKKVEYDPEGNYPMGCNMAFYIGAGNFMVEMETMGKEITLKPLASAHNIETWVLKPFTKNPDDIIKLFF